MIDGPNPFWRAIRGPEYKTLKQHPTSLVPSAIAVVGYAMITSVRTYDEHY